MWQVKNAEIMQDTKSLYFRQFIIVKIQNLQFCQIIQPLYFDEVIFGHQDHLQSRNRQVLHLPDLIVIKVDVEQVRKGN